MALTSVIFGRALAKVVHLSLITKKGNKCLKFFFLEAFNFLAVCFQKKGLQTVDESRPLLTVYLQTFL